MGFTYLFHIPNVDTHQVDQKIIEKPVPAKKKIQNERQHQELLTFLSKCKTNISEIDEFGWTPLHKAIELNDVEIVKQIISHSKGMDLNFTNHIGTTPLTYAISVENLQVIKFLIINGADINIVDRLGWTPVSKAICVNNLEIFNLLIEYGADVNLVDSNGITPLMKSINWNKMEMIKILI